MHEHHQAALKWLKSRGRLKWASCPMTQLGVIRLLTSPRFSADALPLDQAVTVLKRNIEQPLHEFWPDSVAVPRLLEGLVEHTRNYRQTTDAYLLGLAVRKKGKLATLDLEVKQLALDTGKEAHVELLSL